MASNDDEKKRVVSKEWMTRLLDRKIPGVLKRMGDSKATSVADFAKLIELERKRNLRKPRPVSVKWVEFEEWDEYAEELEKLKTEKELAELKEKKYWDLTAHERELLKKERERKE